MNDALPVVCLKYQPTNLLVSLALKQSTQGTRLGMKVTRATAFSIEKCYNNKDKSEGTCSKSLS